MKGFSRAILLLALTQLGACAVMSKNECITADWRQVGYGVGMNGNTDISKAYNAREKACAKHGESAIWSQFQQGHADGIVQYCQLDNAVELGVSGAHRAIDNNVCPDRDYPGFREAFGVGYKLHALRSRAHESSSLVSSLNSRIYRYEKDIRRINHDLDAEDVSKSERKYLRQERRAIRSYIYDLEREIDQCRQRLYRQQSAASNYAEYVYEDYLVSLNDEFVDPRVKRKVIRTTKQSSFEDRVDEVLNE